jgi:hypothetical protein
VDSVAHSESGLPLRPVHDGGAPTAGTATTPPSGASLFRTTRSDAGRPPGRTASAFPHHTLRPTRLRWYSQ